MDHHRKLVLFNARRGLFLLRNPNPTLENETLHKIKGPPESCNFEPPPPPSLGGGGSEYSRLGLPFISATRKVRENTKK